MTSNAHEKIERNIGLMAMLIAVASVNVGVANSSVCPSGVALVTDETAILPPPSGLPG